MATRKLKAPHLKQIGLNIRSYREALRMTQEQLAEKADLHDRTIGKIERGELNFSILIFIRLCKALNLSSDQILKSMPIPPCGG
jgi:DNA-binding XRE family transcriptional regulator